MTPLWLSPETLVLASGSTTRRQMLAQAGIPCEVELPSLDERAVERQARADGGRPADIAGILARAKAVEVSRRRPGRWVLGADQTLTLGGEALHKPRDRADAARQLSILSGREHELRSAAAVARDGAVVFDAEAVAMLSVRTLTDDAISRYLDATGQAVVTSVGGYQVEGPGVTLFDRIAGDHFTIMGLPLLPLLDRFRREGLMP